MPTISVIVPVYKVEPYLRRCIDSILAQTFTDFDVILVDDGSPDGCPAICDEYAEKDPRVHVIHQSNSGISATRNTGIEWAATNSSKWISFVDSDDWIHEMYLEALYRAATENGTGISACRYERTSGEDIAVDADRLDAVLWSTEDFYVDNSTNAVVPWGKLYRKEDFSGIFYPVGKIHEDQYTTHKILFRYPQIPVVEQPLYAYYHNGDGIMKAEWTPRFLVGADAWEEHISFFEQKHLDKARLTAIRKLLRHLRHHIKCMREYGDRYKTECREYMNRYRLAFRKYRSELSREEKGQAYAFVHPVLKPLITFSQIISKNRKTETAKNEKS